MPLSDTAARQAKFNDKPQKLSDEKGLFLLVNQSGKYWRLKYRHGGKEKTLALGVYPEVSLKEARAKRDDARRVIAEGVDQTRGWFFTLHAIATMIDESVSFKNIISNGLVLDKNGNKMSKRLGNAIEPFAAVFDPPA